MTEDQVIWELRQIQQFQKEQARAMNPNAPANEETYYDDAYVPGVVDWA
jgi:hypothetical protein